MKPQDRTRAILRSSLPSTETFVLIALADHCDATDETFIGAPALAAETRLDSRTIRRALASLETRGVLIADVHPGRATRRRFVAGALQSAGTPGTGSGVPLSQDQGYPGQDDTPDRTSPLIVDQDPPGTGSGVPLSQDQGTPDRGSLPVPTVRNTEQPPSAEIAKGPIPDPAMYPAILSGHLSGHGTPPPPLRGECSASPAQSALAFEDQQATPSEPEPSTDAPLPWLPRDIPAALRPGVQALVIGALEAITGRPVVPLRCAGSAREVLGLWRALGRPPPDELLADLQLVARAARECPAPLFARDLRAEGWAEGSDRSRSVPTLCVRRRWDERVSAAKEWAAAGYPVSTAPPARASPTSRTSRALDALRSVGARAPLVIDVTCTEAKP